MKNAPHKHTCFFNMTCLSAPGFRLTTTVLLLIKLPQYRNDSKNDKKNNGRCPEQKYGLSHSYYEVADKGDHRGYPPVPDVTVSGMSDYSPTHPAEDKKYV